MTTVTTPAPATPMIVPLPPGGSSCATCGLVVARPDPRTVTTLMSLGRMPAPGQPHVQAMDQAVQVEFALCPACAAIHDRAAVLLDEHPRVERRLGSRHHAMQKVENALVALDLLGASADWLTSDAALLLAIEHLSTPGGIAMWAARFVPFVQPSVAFDTATTHRYADVSPEVRALAREGMAAVLRARVDRPIDVPRPPDDDGPTGGCGWCGVSSVTVMSSQRESAWVRRSGASQPAARGLPRGEVWLCAQCDAEAVTVGSFGRTAMARALLIHLDPSGHVVRSLAAPQEAMEVVGWAAIEPSERPEPSPERWSHLDLDDLRRALGLPSAVT